MGIRIQIALLYFVLAVGASTPARAESPEPDRYLFDRASEVYRVFGEIRKSKTQKPPARSLASVSPVLKEASVEGAFGSLASQIGQALRTGQVSPSDIRLDIQLPDDSAQATQRHFE